MWVADYGCLLVYETPDGSGEIHRFENFDQVKDFLEKREESSTWKALPTIHAADPVPRGLRIFIIERQGTNVFIKIDLAYRRPSFASSMRP